MNADVINALIAAGIKPADAGRLAAAIDAAYKPGPQSSSFSSGQSSGVASPGDAAGFALSVSAPGTSIIGQDSLGNSQSGPGGAALGVIGSSLFDGDTVATGAAYANSVESDTDISAKGAVNAADANFSEGLSVGDSVSIGEEGIVSDVPIVAYAPVIASGGLETNSQAIFNDLVDMADETYIQGLDIVPHQVQVLGSFSAGGDKLHMLPLEISVLANHGNPAPSAISFALSASTQNQNVVTAVPWTATTSPYLTSVSTTSDTVTVPTHAQVVALSPITYVTQAVGSVTATTSVVVGGLNVSINASAINIVTGGTFNPATCLLSLTSSSVDVVHSISITTSPATVVTAISTAAAPTETKNNIGQSGDAVLAGGSPQILVGNVASATSPAVNFVGITASTSAITYATGGTIVVSAG